tara:strand:+ start:512 stop:685 length:174 start_codon:yes stop_codon:yes gene_type:complete
MKVGDKVQFVLYDKEFTGSISEVCRRKGWEGYINVKMDFDGKKLYLPKSLLRVVNEA